jgi:class 3 adenylate cyclase
VANCGKCGAELPPRFRFCGSCGAPVEAAREREVRKVVTVLFCDASGSTALGERLDPELLRRVIRRYFEAIARVIVAHGGLVEKFAGDAVMAVFGLPQAYEDDACGR